MLARTLLFPLFWILSCAVYESGSNAVDECNLDHDHSLPLLDPCLVKGELFVHTYNKRLGKERDYKNKCRDYTDFRECVRAVETRCPAQVKPILDTLWTEIIKVMDCHCHNNTHDKCEDNLACIEDELNGMFSKRCAAYHDFNTAQHTRHRCHFRQHELECKARLVSNACGEQAGHFSTALSQIEGKKSHNCPLTRPRPNAGSQYLTQCPRNLTLLLQECGSKAFDVNNGNIEFLQENKLIVKDKHVKKACKRYDVYKMCIAPLEEVCSEGIRHLMDMQQKTRNYMSKMEYICHHAKEGYTDNLKCYKKTQRDGTLSQCLPIWNETLFYLREMSAVEFYCSTSSSSRLNVIRTLNELRTCYQNKFTATCGETAGEVMGKFIENVITDPYYLGYQFRPECSLHIDGYTTPTPLYTPPKHTETESISPSTTPKTIVKPTRDKTQQPGKAQKVRTSGGASVHRAAVSPFAHASWNSAFRFRSILSSHASVVLLFVSFSHYILVLLR